MKKIRSLKLFLILIFGMIVIPKNVFAENVVRNFSGTIDYYQQQGYYYGQPDVHNGINGGYLVDETSSISFPSSTYYLIRPIDTNVNFIYALKQITINSSVSVERGRYYTIALEVNRGSYVKLGSEISSIYNITSDSECYSNVGTCSWSWGSNYQYMIISFVPNSNSSNYFIRIGNQANANKVIGLNTYTMGSQGFRVIGASITNSNDAIDISPMINEQKETNRKLEDINNNITNTNNKLDTTNDNLEDINNNITNDDTSTSQNSFTNFINNYDRTDTTGITRLITAPLRLIQVFTTATCNPLIFQLPIVHNEVTLQCPRQLYIDHFGVFFTLWQMITTGVISYNVAINIYSKVRAMSNPNNDRIEVLNL